MNLQCYKRSITGSTTVLYFTTCTKLKFKYTIMAFQDKIINRNIIGLDVQKPWCKYFKSKSKINLKSVVTIYTKNHFVNIYTGVPLLIVKTTVSSANIHTSIESIFFWGGGGVKKIKRFFHLSNFLLAHSSLISW